MALEKHARQQVLDLLHDQDFVAFMQDAPEDYLLRSSFEDFIQQHIPPDLDAEFAWEFVSFMRRVSGRPTVAEINAQAALPLAEHDFWAMNTDVLSRFTAITNRSTPPSSLWQKIKSHEMHAFAMTPIVMELHAACQRDGLALEYETVRSIVIDKTTPTSKAELVLTNALALSRDLDVLATEQPSVELLESLHARLSKGADDLYPIAYQPPKPAVPHLPTNTSDELLAKIVYGCMHPDDWGIHPLFGILLNADIIWVSQPFERFNGLMEVLIRWISYIRIGVPVLRFVPLSKKRLDWEHRLIGAPEAPMRYGEAVIVGSFGVDSTPYLLQTTKFLIQGLEHLEAAVTHREEEAAHCKTLIERDGRFTLRQKQLLSELIDDPTRTIDVQNYETHFDVATSTARSDLMKLVSAHYLMTEFQGKKQVFWIRPDIGRTR